MKKRLMEQLSIFTILLFLFSCSSSLTNEKQLSVSASEKFYENFIEQEFQDIADRQIDSERGSKLVEKLKTVRELLGNISDKTLKKTEAGSSENGSAMVSCIYEIQTESGTHYQRIIWRINKENAKLIDVWTHSYNEKGEIRLLVSDGKILL